MGASRTFSYYKICFEKTSKITSIINQTGTKASEKNSDLMRVGKKKGHVEFTQPSSSSSLKQFHYTLFSISSQRNFYREYIVTRFKKKKILLLRHRKEHGFY